MTKIKNIFEPYLTQGLYSRMYFHHLAENRLRSCRDPRDPAAILAILPRSCCDNRNNRFAAIDRHYFLVQLCDCGSQVTDKIIADRHCFLVGPVSFLLIYIMSRLINRYPRYQRKCAPRCTCALNHRCLSLKSK